MRRLEDMMDFYEWKEELGVDSLSEMEAENVLRRTLEKAGLPEPVPMEGQSLDFCIEERQSKGTLLDSSIKERKRRCRYFSIAFGRKQWMLVAVCFLVVILGTVSFAEIILDRSIVDLFHPQNEQQLASLRQMGAIINQSVENNGSVLIFRQAVSDKHAVYVTMDFVAPEGTVLNAPYYHFQDIGIYFPDLGNMPCGYYLESLPDENPQDNRVSFILCFSGEKDLRGEKMQISLKGLKTMKSQEEIDEIKALPPMTEPGTPGDAYDWETVVIEGIWETEFQLSSQDSTFTFRPNEEVGGSCEIKKVKISPISLTIEVKGNSIQDYDSVPPDMLGKEDDEDGSIEILLLMKDGSQVEFSGGSQAINWKTLTLTKTFRQIIDPAQIASITFAGTTLTF